MFSGVPQLLKPIKPKHHEVRTVADLVFKLDGFKSAAARALRIDRATMYRYLGDTNSEHHEIRFRKGRYELLTVLGTAK